jgi:hypothetical protein
MGPTGSIGSQGSIGYTGTVGATGPSGSTGSVGSQGLLGPTGNDGATGPIGSTGSLGDTGAVGPTGNQGMIGYTGPQGFTGAEGKNAAISSIFVWSDLSQNHTSITTFQYVYFENVPTGPAGSGWTTITDPSFTHPTAFVVPSSGFYLLTYKIDVRSGGNLVPGSNSDCATVLTKNGNEINGSATLVEAPETNHIYTISNTVLVDLSFNDRISLLFWSGDIGSHIGDPSFLTGKLPNGNIPKESTASIVFSKISN